VATSDAAWMATARLRPCRRTVYDELGRGLENPSREEFYVLHPPVVNNGNLATMVSTGQRKPPRGRSGPEATARTVGAPWQQGFYPTNSHPANAGPARRQGQGGPVL